MTKPTSQILRPRQVADKLGVSIATIWRWTKYRSDFPKPFHIGPRATGFEESAIEAFIERSKNGESNRGYT